MDAIIFTNLEDRKSLRAELTTNNWKIFSNDVLETNLGAVMYYKYLLIKMLNCIIHIMQHKFNKLKFHLYFR